MQSAPQLMPVPVTVPVPVPVRVTVRVTAGGGGASNCAVTVFETSMVTVQEVGAGEPMQEAGTAPDHAAKVDPPVGVAVEVVAGEDFGRGVKRLIVDEDGA